MPESQIPQAVQLLDLMLEHFVDDGHWTRDCHDDGNGGHCLVGALLHLSRKHRLPRAPAIALLQDAMPRPGLPLVHFNDTCCGSVAELRSIILKARRLADDHAEQERATTVVKTWLLAQIEKKRRAPAAAIADTSPDVPFAPNVWLPSVRPQQLATGGKFKRNLHPPFSQARAALRPGIRPRYWWHRDFGSIGCTFGTGCRCDMRRRNSQPQRILDCIGAAAAVYRGLGTDVELACP
jgi:hypothetical protein